MRREFVQKYDVIHKEWDLKNPLSVGNGDFAFTCDITGLQSFYKEYSFIPLCTMANLYWAHQKGIGELPYKEYQRRSDGKRIRYLTDTSSSNYDAYRDDWFKFDLFKLGFYYRGKPLDSSKTQLIEQHLSLYDGIIYSTFLYDNEKVFVETKTPQSHHNLQIKVKTSLKDLQIRLYFLKPSSNQAGCQYPLDDTDYQIAGNQIIRTSPVASYSLYFQTNMKNHLLWFDCALESYLTISLTHDFLDDFDMNTYFRKAKSYDTLDEELNRRMVLSLYLMKINTLGKYPPAETGLTCNSWYGKFHLEMHLWHHLGLIRFGLYEYVLPSLKWYLTIYDSSKKRALDQGYQGIRLPKMTDPRGVDTPSNIGCLLIWQMPHLLVMLDEIFKQDEQIIDLKEFLPMIMGLIDFMSSFYYLKDGKYHLDSPLIPANENVSYTCDTPIFEECYTLYAFDLFLKWKKKFHFEYDTTRILDILKNYAPLEIKDGCYEAYIGCKETYTRLNHDHPMMIGMYSYFESQIVKPEIIDNTLQKILAQWSLDDTWGWDFPMLAMSAARLNHKELAIQILKKDALKNGYSKNGHNPQIPKEALPLYLPGNGAFLLAVTHIFKETKE